MRSALPAGGRLLSKPRIALAASLVAVLVLGLGHAPAMAAEPHPYRVESVEPVPRVPVKAAKIAPAPKLTDPPPASARPAPVWPKAAGEVITGQAESLPVRVAQHTRTSPSRVQVEVLDRKTTEKAGVRGVLMRLGRADGVAAASPTKVTLDYRSFANAYGADWSSRLQLVSLPACALTTPGKAGCEGTPLGTDNDVAAQTLSADVAVSSVPTLVAAEAAASGPAGDYSATTLNASSTWSAGGNSGDFTWSYPMRVPPALGGPAPEVGLSYSSQSVDGRHAASNNQPSRVGEGFEEPAGGFIERSFQSCAEDMGDSANNEEKTGDLCWETDNATLSLAGHSGELIYNATEGRWHLRGDDGSRVERKTGATNGDNNGEYWVVTTTDGVQYWFGINRLPGWTAGKPLTNSVLTAPVFGNDTGEPCHATAFADSDCTQAWRWNLDYVFDPLGNSMSYWYEKATNKYARNLDESDAALYDRESWLERIDYGTRRIGAIESAHNTLAPMRVDFTYADRCLNECTTHNATRWPDVPWDSECTGDKCEDLYSPTFWSTKRLASVTTQIRNGTTYRDVDRWTLTHTFPDPGDGTRAGLWLNKLSHAGLVGSTLTMPDVEFTPVQKANRVDITGDFAAAMNWMRIARIRTETGATISVVYSEQDCRAGATPSPATNTSRCYPVKWIPQGYEDPVTDWFNKYVVTTIYEQDNTGGVPPLGSPRKVYQYSYLDGAAWHYSDDDGLIKKKYKTWSSYRGYGKVGVTIGDPGEQTYSETRYFRGMNGDRLNADGGIKPASVDGIADEDWFAGKPRETITYNGPGGAVVSRNRHTPWASAPTASRTVNGDTVTARYTGVGTTTSHVTLDGGRGERVTKMVSTYDQYGMVTQVDDLGEDGVPGDEQCIQTDYTPRNTSLWIMNRAHNVKSFAVRCSATTGTLTEAQVIGETRTLFDNLAYKATPTKGLPTQEQNISAWNSGAPAYVTTAKNVYDVHGRSTSVTDALGYVTTNTYTPVSDGPLTGTSTTNHLKHTKSATIEPAWGTPTATVDVNGKRTDTDFDAMGRLIAVWKPGRTKGTDTAHIKYAYDINAGAPSVVTASTINAAGGYVTTYTLYDGLLRQRQTQAPSPSGGRIVTENFYDTAGRQTLAYSPYHTSGNPGGTLLATSDAATVPTQTRTVYDGAGRTVATVFQPYGVERWRTTTAYGGDRTDATPPAGGTATSTVTDARGRTIELRQYTGAVPTPYTAGSWVRTAYEFDARGYRTRVLDNKDNDWVYTYDIRGRQTKVDDPDRGVTTFTYDNAGNQLTSTDARGKKLAYDYDALNRKVAVFDNEVGGVLRAQWIYDTVAKGMLSTSTRFMGSVGYQSKVLDYNDAYQPLNTQIIIPETETGVHGIYNYSTTYNLDGSVRSSTIPGANTDLQPETLTFGYNAFGQPTTLDSLYGTTNQPYVTGTDYDALSHLDQVKLYTGTGAGGRVYTKFTHELETGRLTNIRTDRDSVAPYILSDTSFRYDDAGNILGITDAAPEGADDIQCFTYDRLARLTEAWTPESGDCAAAPSTGNLGGPAPYWHSWTFDTIGNRLSETTRSTSGPAATTEYQYPASGAASVRPHAAAGTTGARAGTFTYDTTGNTLTRPTTGSGTQTFTWDAEGRVDTVTDTTGTTSYVYDADGNRLLQRDPAGRTLYLPGQEVRYTNSTAATTCTRYYGHAGGTIGSRNRSGLTWLSPDHQGTANVAINATDQQATIRRQTPYGNERGTANGMWPNSRGFVGGVIDNTGLTHLGAREYDPLNGRFISVDPVQDLTDPQQWNGYAYANNNPITFSDPSGLCIWANDWCEPKGVPDPGEPPVADEPDGGNDNPGNGGNNGGGDIGSTPVDVSNGLKDAMKDYGFEANEYTLNTLAAFGAENTANWELLCVHLSSDAEQCKRDNPFTVDHSVGETLLLTGLIVGAIAVPLVCSVATVGCVAAAYEIAAGELAFAGTGALLGTGGVMMAGSRLTKLGSIACSFSGDTEILLADGTTKPFDEVAIGEEVLATDPATGEKGHRPISRVWVHEDDLYVLGVGGRRLVTTEDHPFWNETDKRWEAAARLDPGDLVRTPTGTARVDGFDRRAHRRAAAFNLTVSGIHTYYVMAGDTPVLVHNLCPVDDLAEIEAHVLPRHWTGGELTTDAKGNIVKAIWDPDVDLLELAQTTNGKIGMYQNDELGRIEYVFDTGGKIVGNDDLGNPTTVYTVIRTSRDENFGRFLRYGDLVTMHPGTPTPASKQ